MDSFIAGAEQLVDDRAAAGEKTGATYRVPGAPWRIVWHTTEVVPDTAAGCRALAIRHDWPPHIWAAPQYDWVGQTVPLNLAAYALEHDGGDPETNHAHAIQVEVFGHAANRPLSDPAVCRWLGQRVLGPVLATGLPIEAMVVAPSTGADGAGESGRVRLTWEQWRNFPGQCGHANVPGNQHWDPGVADYLAIARAAQPPEPPPAPTTGDDGMFAYDRTHGQSKVLVIVCSGKQTRVIGATVGGKVRNAGYYIGHVDDQMADWIDANYGPIEGL